MALRKTLAGVLLAALMAGPGVTWAQTYDVLQLPAEKSDLASKSLIHTIRQFGDRYFATGHRGHILFSDDGGETWTQASVPVRSSILDVHFPTPELGWAVGHEAVILHSSDGGKTWALQYDGLRYGEEGLAFYEEMSAADPNNPILPFMVQEMEFSISQGADKPLFKVYFHDDKFGHALGAYGMLLVTYDGGKKWEHRMHTAANESFYHIFDYAPLPEQGKFFLSGEAGLFMVGDALNETAEQIYSVPWEGSFFTSMDTSDGAIVMGGLRGRMFRTEDVGQTWQVVEKPPTSAIVDSARLADGSLIFVGIAGEILHSTDNGNSFSPLPISSGDRVYTVAPGPGRTLLVGGPKGIRKLQLPEQG